MDDKEIAGEKLFLDSSAVSPTRNPTRAGPGQNKGNGVAFLGTMTVASIMQQYY